MKKILLVILLFPFFALGNLDYNCSNNLVLQDVERLAKEAASNQLTKDESKQFQSYLVNIITNSYDPNIGTYTCKAQMEMGLKNKGYIGSIDITYKIERIANGSKDFHVNVYGL